MLDFDKSNEVLFRLGIIYKQQTKYDESLGCFDRILRNPPSPLANADIWFQIGHVYEQQGDVRVSLLRIPAASYTPLSTFVLGKPMSAWSRRIQFMRKFCSSLAGCFIRMGHHFKIKIWLYNI